MPVTHIAFKFGFATNDVAKAAYDELNSLAFKLNTDVEVTAVNAALLQVFAKFR